MLCSIFQHVITATAGVVPDQIREGTEEEKRTWLHDSVAEVVDTFLTSSHTFIKPAAVTDAAQGSAKERLPCRQPGCPRVYVNKKSRETHEQKIHHLVVAPVTPAQPASTSLRDCKQQHSQARLSFGFLLMNMLDAVKEGDGERLIRLYKDALLIYKAYGHTQYAYSTFLLSVQLNASLSPKWDKVKNGLGCSLQMDEWKAQRLERCSSIIHSYVYFSIPLHTCPNLTCTLTSFALCNVYLIIYLGTVIYLFVRFVNCLL